MEPIEMRPPGWRSCLALVGILLATVVIRLIPVGQPIVENYVGRQVPTAMVARNLERGSGFLHPQLDVAPFPNYFLVEPPLYQSAVAGVRRITGWSLESSGRLVSALATALAAWGLFGLARRREGEQLAFAAVAAFALFPITIRYGRAFQPDALMLGAVVAGLNCWDIAVHERRRGWLVVAWLGLAVGFAAKITAAFLLIPLGFAIIRPRKPKALVLAISTLGPALCWYLWANHLVESGAGSRASADNRAIWLEVVGLSAWRDPETWRHITRFLVVRSFTPLGLALAVWGLRRRAQVGERPDLWRIWGGACLLVMAALAEKLHHEYYWLVLAPVVAVGLGRAWVNLAAFRQWLAWSTALVLIGSSAILVRSTWQTPPEWSRLEEAAEIVRTNVPPESWVVAPEPLLYQADRRGCRLEFTSGSAKRAASEWGECVPIEGPLNLIDVYRGKGARYFADVAAGVGDSRRMALHESIRRRYKVIVDGPAVILAELNAPEIPRHGL